MSSKPIDSRFLVSLRTQNDFDDVDKYNPNNTTEAILEQQKKSNPYMTNRNLRRSTKGMFTSNSEVRRMGDQNDGVIQQNTIRQQYRLNEEYKRTQEHKELTAQNYLKKKKEMSQLMDDQIMAQMKLRDVQVKKEFYLKAYNP